MRGGGPDCVLALWDSVAARRALGELVGLLAFWGRLCREALAYPGARVPGARAAVMSDTLHSE